MNQNTTIFLPICDKIMTAEVGCEYSMPDYQPEVRRLVRVRATVLPPASYVGAGKAEFAGAVRFDVLYSGNDGQLYSASTAENYELSAPLDRDADVDMSDEPVWMCDVDAETVNGRVTAPRKLSLRCRLRGRVGVFGRHRLCERLIGDVSGVERLVGESTCAVLVGRASEMLNLSDEVPFDGGEGELRVISGEAAVNVTETQPSEDGVGCRGEAVLRLLTCREGSDAVPAVTVRRIPFTVSIPADGFDAETSCRAVGCCTELSTEVTEDGRVLCDLALTVTAEGQKNQAVVYTADLYSTESENSAVYTDYRFPRAARCISGNFTQSVYEPLTSYGLEDGCEVVDVSAVSNVENVVFDRGRWVLSGESRVHLLVRNDEEYAGHELTLPFRYETDGEGGEPVIVSADVVMTSGRARVEGGRLGLECEMAVSARICTEESLTALTEARFGEPLTKPTELVVAFPARGETMWSLAKRYHAPLAVLDRLNSPVPPSAALPTGKPIVICE